MKTFKIVLITKNDKHSIKQWIDYHGNILGYENLHIIDDSDDVEILDYYKSISSLNLYQNNKTMDNVLKKINEVMDSVRDDCDFMIKMDADEFLGVYDQVNSDIFISKDVIINTIEKISINGLKYKCSHTIESAPQYYQDNIFDYTNFTLPFPNNFKTFFYSKTYEFCDLGSHTGKVKDPYDSNLYNETSLAIVHYHFLNFKLFVETCRKTVIAHGYIDQDDDIETQIKKLKNSGGDSQHKINFYLRYLTCPDFENVFYQEALASAIRRSGGTYQFKKLKDKYGTTN